MLFVNEETLYALANFVWILNLASYVETLIKYPIEPWNLHLQLCETLVIEIFDTIHICCKWKLCVGIITIIALNWKHRQMVKVFNHN